MYEATWINLTMPGRRDEKPGNKGWKIPTAGTPEKGNGGQESRKAHRMRHRVQTGLDKS